MAESWEERLAAIRREACEAADRLGGDVNFIECGLLEHELRAALQREATAQEKADSAWRMWNEACHDIGKLQAERDAFKRLYEAHYEGMDALGQDIKRLEAERDAALRVARDNEQWYAALKAERDALRLVVEASLAEFVEIEAISSVAGVRGLAHRGKERCRAVLVPGGPQEGKA